MLVFKLIGHFRVPKTLTFKIRPSAQPFLWKWDLFAWEWKIVSIRHLHISLNASYLPPKFCITPVFHFPGYYSRPKRNWKHCLCKTLGEQIRCIMGDVQVTKGWAPNLVLIQRSRGTRKWPVTSQLLQLGCFLHTHAVSRASSERAEGEWRGANSSVEAVTDFFLGWLSN